MDETTIGVQVAIDCADPAALAPFWAAVLGYQLQPPPAGFDTWPAYLASIGIPEERWNSASSVVDPAGVRPRLYFQRVPEAKAGKNRLHLDLKVTDLKTAEDERRVRLAAEVVRLVGLGATRVGEVAENGEYWIVMQDPEGNEFCIS